MRASGLLLAAALLLAACLSAEGFAAGGLSAAGAARSTAAGVCRGLPLQVCLARWPLPPAASRASAGRDRALRCPCTTLYDADVRRGPTHPAAHGTCVRALLAVSCALERLPVGACPGAARGLTRRSSLLTHDASLPSRSPDAATRR